jgi:hypothetical protein
MKFADSRDWQEVSETTFLQQLSEIFYPVSPVIIKMIKGCEVYTPHANFRLKMSQAGNGIFVPNKVATSQATLN